MRAYEADVRLARCDRAPRRGHRAAIGGVHVVSELLDGPAGSQAGHGWEASCHTLHERGATYVARSAPRRSGRSGPAD